MISSRTQWSLMLAPVLPLAILLFGFWKGHGGHRWNVHGDFLGLFALFLGSLAVGGVAVIFALAKMLPALARDPGQRTPWNVLCASIAVAFLLVCAGFAFSLA